jgi:hypothetical protein
MLKLIQNSSYWVQFQTSPRITHLTKQSNTCRLLLLLMYSPIIFLSSRGFSRRKCTTSCASRGVDNRWCSCRNIIPFFGFELNCSDPEASSWNAHKTPLNYPLGCYIHFFKPWYTSMPRTCLHSSYSRGCETTHDQLKYLQSNPVKTFWKFQENLTS